MGYFRAENPVLHFEDINGRPLVGGKLFTYEAGTSTPVATYRDAAGQFVNENPILLNERGECVCFMADNAAYKLVLKDKFDTVIWEADDIRTQPGGVVFTGNVFPMKIFTEGDHVPDAEYDPLDEEKNTLIQKSLRINLNGTQFVYKPFSDENREIEILQPDWAQNDSSKIDYIRNKPENIVQDSSYVHTDNNFTDTLKNKLDGIKFPSMTGNEGKSLCVNSDGTDTEWAQKTTCIVINGSSNVECSTMTVNQEGGNAGLVRMRPVGGSNVPCGWLVPYDFGGHKDEGFYPTPTNVNGSPTLKWIENPAAISPLEKVTKTYTDSSHPNVLEIQKGKWYDLVISGNSSPGIILVTGSTDTVHTYINVRRNTSSDSGTPDIEWTDERFIEHIERCDVSNGDSYLYEVFIKDRYYNQSSQTYVSLARVRKVEE